MMDPKRTVLMILDGWGLGAGDGTDAVAKAHTPFMDSLYRDAPWARLLTHAEYVGLPSGQMGNSEVGHLNIGAGRIVDQDLVRIDKAAADGELAGLPELQLAFEVARRKGGRLHLIGLLSDGGVHSMRHHAEILAELALEAGVKEVFLHAFTDGRDTDPHSGRGQVELFMERMKGTGVRVASIVGRYFAMDRDQRWERIARAYKLLVNGVGTPVKDPLAVFDASYANGRTDEFIEPHVVVDDMGSPVATIDPDDTVICFNYRTDRCREITIALTQRPFPELDMAPLVLHYVTMTEYDPTYKGVHVLFRKDNLVNTLGEVVANAGKKQIRIAETEKYPHVTFFFSGGREEPFHGEKRIMIPSPKVATYDLAPEMSALKVMEAIKHELHIRSADLVVINFANPDMVGHTGVFEAIKKAVATVDACAKEVVEAGRKEGYSIIIIADHGNADKAVNPDGTPNTAHSMNPVPIVVLAEEVSSVRDGILADVAPTVLHLMGMEKPVEMTGSSLIVE